MCGQHTHKGYELQLPVSLVMTIIGTIRINLALLGVLLTLNIWRRVRKRKAEGRTL
jgi:hypothetical protein